MKAAVDCIPCFFRQALDAARFVTDDPAKHKSVLDALAREIPGIALDKSPIHYAPAIYNPVKRIAGKDDPFLEWKRRYNQKALSIYPRAKTEVERAPDPLLTAIRFALAGNVIDFGPNPHFDFDREIENVRTHPFGLCDDRAFRERLRNAGWVLYLGDNAGEIVFDRLLVETLGKPVVFVVRGGPAINDATLEDAAAVGMVSCASVISNGSDYAGTVLEACSAEFQECYAKAPLVIAKGHGNFETLDAEKKAIAFLLKAKCAVVARMFGVAVGEWVLKMHAA